MTSGEIEHLITSLSRAESREDLANFHDYVGRHKTSFQDFLNSWHKIEERDGVPNDAKDLQNATYHYLEQVIKADESLEKLTVLAGDKNIKDEELQSKKEQLKQSLEEISRQADALNKEQEKFAKENNIKFFSLS